MKAPAAVKLAGVVLGALAGWLYWRYVGCLGGSCPIWSNPWFSSGYGGLVGFLLGGLFRPRRSAKNDAGKPETPSGSQSS